MAKKGGYYDKNKDYSAEIRDAQQNGASQSYIDQLRQERQNKIDDKYGGKDPYQGNHDIMGNRGGSSSGSSSGGSSWGGSSSGGSSWGGSSSGGSSWGSSPSGGQSYTPTPTPAPRPKPQTAEELLNGSGGDYSLAIVNAQKNGASADVLSQLRAGRQAKINSQYGGMDPYRGTMDIMGNKPSVPSVYTGSDGYQYVEHRDLEHKNGLNYGGWSKAADGSIWLDDTPQRAHWKQLTGGVDLSRRPDLAGKSAMSHGHTVFYDDLGYAHTSRQGVTGYRPHIDPYVTGNGPVRDLWTDQEMMTKEDYERLGAIKDQLASGALNGDQANAAANAIRKGYGYTMDKQGYVTALDAAGLAAARRQEWGMGGPGPTAEQAELMSKIFPWGVRAPGVSPDYLEREYGYVREDPTPTVNPGSWGNAHLDQSGYGGYGGYGGQTGQGNPGGQGGFRGSGSYGGGGSPFQGGSAEQYIRNLAAQQQAAMEAALRAAFDKNAAGLKGQDDLISSLYEDQRNRAAAQNELERLRMAEMGMAQGLGSGTTGQLALGQSTAFQDALAGIGQQEAQAKLQVADRLRELEANYQNQIAQAISQNNAQMAENLYKEFIRQQQQELAAWQEAQKQSRWEMEFQRDQDRWDAQWKRQQMLDQWNQAADMAKLGDYSGYQGLGVQIPLDDVGLPPTTPDRPKEESGGGYNNSGLSRDEIKALQRKVGVTPDGMWGQDSVAAANRLAGDRGSGTMSARDAMDMWGVNNSGPERGWKRQTFANLLATGQRSAAQALYEKEFPNLTIAEQNEWNQIFSRYGAR